ncbi:metallophosphoesterase [Dyadobacter sp. NIV53]|uniref:metallophosphoesterase n=1 Tax=Dyadobacter sp. NIV53 TaxID=2861765 RepID=UPI001C88466D|nr:metallophosphoesterase [Dyadobacter sp. NIV53]
MKYYLYLFFILSGFTASFGQDSIRYRVIFVGDAGEMNPKQQKALHQAADLIIPEKTIVMFLGDNIYPHGMGLPGDDDELVTQQVLKSQFSPMRAKGAPTYFVPGNHDWDRSGKEGLAKIKRQGQFLGEQSDPQLKLLPANGCPDPVALNLSDSLTVIVYDSEWWLFPFDKSNADCNCKTKEDVLLKMSGLRDQNKGKFIILASHHPFQSYGTHGGKYSLKDHIFPLTAVKKYLWIPLPIIGSLYPLLRTKFKNPEDMKHPLYQDLIQRVEQVFDSTTNVVHAAGHEHGLQFIKGKHIQVVSGAGAKHNFVKKGKNSLFADATQGFVTVDLLTGGSLKFTFYIYKKGSIRQEFTYSLAYSTGK